MAARGTERIAPRRRAAAPQQQTKHTDYSHRPKQNGSHSPIHMVLDGNGKDSHKTDRHREPVPEQGVITWFEVIVGRAETGQKNAEEE